VYLREYIKQGNKIVASQRGCWTREFVLEEEDIKARCYIWLKSQVRVSLSDTLAAAFAASAPIS
jgi:hypothetical protein